MASSTVEDYLKQLYLEQHAQGGRAVGTGRLAQLMRVTPGTATAMLKALDGNGLARHTARQGATLTEEGERRALQMLRRHRLMELFLVQVLGLDWSVVHAEAEALEHAVSDLVLERIDALVGHPRFDPHGDPIPAGAHGHQHQEAAVQCSLADCALGTAMLVTRIRDQAPDFLRWVKRSGLMPGATIVVHAREAEAGVVHMQPQAGRRASLGMAEAAKILVEPNMGAGTGIETGTGMGTGIDTGIDTGNHTPA